MTASLSVSSATSRFVRPASTGDAQAMGAVHAQTMRASLMQAYADAYDGEPLPAGIEAMIAPPVLESGWATTLASPRQQAHHVLLATEGEEVVGLLAAAPTQGELVTTDGERVAGLSERGVEVTALGVAPAFQRRGHGSRLLAALTDLAHADGARTVLMWILEGESSMEALATSTGLSRTDSWRKLPIGAGLVERCWVCALDTEQTSASSAVLPTTTLRS